MRIVPSGDVLGAVIRDVDLSRSLDRSTFAGIFAALGTHGVLCFPRQTLTPAQLKSFAGHFGTLQKSPTGGHCEPDMPEVTILSNIVENGVGIGLADAGQDRHTDMSYNPVVGFSNILYGIEIPERDGKILGDTLFANMALAYDELPDEWKTRLKGAWAIHDFDKFWEGMRRRPGSTRKPMTAKMRELLPPSRHPVFLTHPITGRTVLYCNPGYTIAIEGMNQADSDAALAFLYAHQLQSKYRFAHHWTVGDVLMWDHVGTLHMARPDYTASERRLVKRCQVTAGRVFDPAFVASVMAPLRETA